ncbi:MAG: SDR family oxidoreductase [Planctomycetales bacterium]|nr:SDR family oxidoreductase [Planctomycetales bacterium]
MRLPGKAIIVTGSTTGIGEAIARRCVAEGAQVLIHGRDQERGEALSKELGDAAVFHADDLSDAEAPPRLVAATLAAFGRIDGLVNNAAWVVRSDLESTDAELFDRCMAINVRAPLLLIRAAVAELKKTAGSIVNIGSVNAYTGEPRQLAYSMSKGALMTMSRNLANVLAVDRVRVTHFNTGWVLSENEYRLKIAEGLPENWPETIGREHVPSGRMTQPEELAAHALFWLSDESRPITGSVIELEQHPVIGRIPLKEGDGDA